MSEKNKKNILYGKNCLVTGSTGGIGSEIALALAKENCNLFLTSTNNSKLKKLKKELKKNHDIKIFSKSADLSSEIDINKLISTIRKKMSHIDILINNAGIFVVKPIEKLEIDDFRKSLDINLTASFILCKELSKDMRKQKWGRIVNIGSSSAYGASKETMAYSASKHALLGLTKSLHEELGEYNIRSFFVSPAGAKTNMGKKIKNQNFDTFVSPCEIAEYITFIIKFNSTMISNEIRLNRMTMG